MEYVVKENRIQKIIIESLQFLVMDNRIVLYNYCILDNHTYFIWQMKGEWLSSQVRRGFFKYIAQRFKKLLEVKYPKALNIFKSTQEDRIRQFWERHTLCVVLHTADVFEQKVNHIHINPVKAGLCIYSEEYIYSSAKYYENRIDEFNFPTHFNG